MFCMLAQYPPQRRPAVLLSSPTDRDARDNDISFRLGLLIPAKRTIARCRRAIVLFSNVLLPGDKNGKNYFMSCDFLLTNHKKKYL